MKKVALVFVLAVFVPSLVLAWLAVRSMRDQELRLERQQSILYQGLADDKAAEIQEALGDCQRTFQLHLAAILAHHPGMEAGRDFDALLRQDWPLAQIGFAVSLTGDLLSPPAAGRAEYTNFWAQNNRFLGNRESVDVFWNNSLGQQQSLAPNAPPVQAPTLPDPTQFKTPSRLSGSQLSATNSLNSGGIELAQNGQASVPSAQSSDNGKRPISKSQYRNVVPQQQIVNGSVNPTPENNQSSRLAAASGEFRELIGEDRQGVLARFIDNKLNVLMWQRPNRQPQLVYGVQLSLPRLLEALKPIIQGIKYPISDDICLALLDDNAKPAALSRPDFRGVWKRPFVATEISEALPHWEVAIYLLDPGRFARSAQTARLLVGLLVAVLMLAIGVGGWLIVADLRRQLTLARQKTDFVSNVSHELKTPLTSIRMFSELLAEGRVADPEKQRAYLGIITAEAGRLTRLINNVLDFARLERGEKKYQCRKCDVVALVAETTAAYRPHLESAGFRFTCELPDTPLFVHGDADALAQVLVNLLSNAEKYSGDRRDVTVRVEPRTTRPPGVTIRVLDRGLGVPKGCEEKIFENFYRAHDSLSSGIQGSGLGLTIARQIARAHGGDVSCAPREGGGSGFTFHLPLLTS